MWELCNVLTAVWMQILVHQSSPCGMQRKFTWRISQDQISTLNNESFSKEKQTVTKHPGGPLPYMGNIGMSRCEGYGFQAVYSRIGYINHFSQN